MSKTIKHYTLGEEIANAVTHGVGVLLSALALMVMVLASAESGDPWRIISVSVFGVTLIACYLASFLYHAIPHPGAKDTMRLLDHCAIFLLIAGTYTPFLLVSMRGPVGWILFGLVWGVAVAGIAFKVVFSHTYPRLSTAMYVSMGWIVVLALKPALEMIPMEALGLMLVGGLIYTAGVIFYHWERLPFNHAIWHLFVLGGSVAHFLAIFYFVVPVGE
jgi:hemolysin III